MKLANDNFILLIHKEFNDEHIQPTFLLHRFLDLNITNVSFLWRTYYFSIDSVYIQLVRYKLNDSCHCHVCNWWFMNNILCQSLSDTESYPRRTRTSIFYTYYPQTFMISAPNFTCLSHMIHQSQPLNQKTPQNFTWPYCYFTFYKNITLMFNILLKWH